MWWKKSSEKQAQRAFQNNISAFHFLYWKRRKTFLLSLLNSLLLMENKSQKISFFFLNVPVIIFSFCFFFYCFIFCSLWFHFYCLDRVNTHESVCERNWTRSIRLKEIDCVRGEMERESWLYHPASETRHWLNDPFVNGSKQLPSLLTTFLVLKEISSAGLALFCQAKLNQMPNFHATGSLGKQAWGGKEMEMNNTEVQQFQSLKCRWFNPLLNLMLTNTKHLSNYSQCEAAQTYRTLHLRKQNISNKTNGNCS